MGKKIFIFVIIFIIAVTVGTGIFFVVKNVEDNTVFVPNSELQIKNVKKYEKKLFAEYSKDNKKNEFLKLADEMQEKSLTYVLDNVTENSDSFDTNVKEVQKIYKNREFNKLGLNYDIINYWVGTWSLDDRGNLKFKFANDNIKPTWVTNEDIKKYII